MCTYTWEKDESGRWKGTKRTQYNIYHTYAIIDLAIESKPINVLEV